MKVIPVVLLVVVLWSQEWKSALSDSIIHIGEFLRFFSVCCYNKALCASLRKLIGAAFSLDVRRGAEITGLLSVPLTPCGI